MKKSTLIAASVYTAFALFVTIRSLFMPLTGGFGLGYGFFPLVVGVFMLALGISWIVSTVRNNRGTDDSKPFYPDKEGRKAVFLMLGASVFFPVSFAVLGYVITVILFFPFLVFVIQKKRGKPAVMALGYFGLLSLTVYLIFGTWIGVAFPSGILG